MRATLTLLLRSVLGVAFTGALVMAGFAWHSEGTAQGADKAKDDEPDVSLSAFMRKKLDASSEILEGLTVEDSEMIQRGAKSLLEMSKAERWKFLIDSKFRAHSVEFNGAVRKLLEAAEKNNFDNAALQWFDATKSCIECHRDVRGASQPSK
ncbi:hypothetical protein [Schlesneria sp. T3-172]|uniref:hypothetical protein n=1 Tax=Schlesneria sphaerica TaxID=3373610 RepID=UPI0037CB1372